MYAAGKIIVALHDSAKKQRFFVGHVRPVAAFALAESGDVMASSEVGKNTVIRVWDYTSGECVCMLGTKQEVTSLSLSSAGHVLAAAGRDRHGKQFVEVYDTATVLKTGKAPVVAQALTDSSIQQIEVRSCIASFPRRGRLHLASVRADYQLPIPHTMTLPFRILGSIV